MTNHIYKVVVTTVYVQGTLPGNQLIHNKFVCIEIHSLPGGYHINYRVAQKKLRNCKIQL